MSIILIGMKGCGKTTIGTSLAEKLQVPFIDADTEIEKTHRRETGEALSFRQIFKNYGAEYFRALETRTLQHIAKECVLVIDRDLLLKPFSRGRSPGSVSILIRGNSH